MYPACAIFTVVWLVVVVVVDSVSDIVNINLASSLMCLVIAIVLASCNLILTRKKMPFVGRFFSHMALSVFGISLTVALFSQVFPTAYALKIESFYLVLLLIVVYLLLATPALLLYHRFVLAPRERSFGKDSMASNRK